MRPSISRRLLLLLIGSTIAIGALQTGLCYRGSRAEADTFYDQHMRLLAEAIAGATRSTSTDTGDIPVTSGAAAGFTIRIRPDTEALLPAGDRAQRSNTTDAPGFSDLQDSTGEWRLYRLRSPHRTTIEVAQRAQARTDMALAMAMGTAWPIFVLTPLVLFGAWWIVRHGVAPVHRIGRALAARTADDLSPVEDSAVPVEVAPLTDEINRLMARVGGLLAAQRRFVGDAAHELRSPLTALKLQVQAMSGTQSVEPSLAAKLGRLDRGVERMHRIVEQLLHLSRTEVRKHEDESADSVELDDAVHRVVSDLAELVREKQLLLRVTVAEQANVAATTSDLDILIANLLDNAIKYSPPGGTVDISVASGPKGAVLSIMDSGPGIPSAERERVFDRFYRLPGNDVSGSGLGLAIVRTITDHIGASISLGEAHLGGLAVKVAFPVSERSAQLGKRSPGHQPKVIP